MIPLTSRSARTAQSKREAPAEKAREEKISLEKASRIQLKLGRHLPFDGIRGVAIVFVILAHLGWKFADGAVVFMDIFFVLSGFLITAVLMQEYQRTGAISLKNFYLRRAMRLFPALFAVLAILAVFALPLPREEAIKAYRSILITFFYAANWVLAFSPREVLGPLNHTWSLAVEEQFYFTWPCALIFLLRRKWERHYSVALLLAVAAASALHRFLLWNGPASRPRVYFALDTRLDSILIGCALGLLFSWEMLPKTERQIKMLKIAGRVSSLFILLVVLTSARDSAYLFQGVLTLVSVATTLVILETLYHPTGTVARVLGFRPLVWMGQLSYGLYIWHYPIFRQFTRFDWAPFVVTLAKLALTFAVASASYYWLEMPFLRLKSRFSATGKSV